MPESEVLVTKCTYLDSQEEASPIGAASGVASGASSTNGSRPKSHSESIHGVSVRVGGIESGACSAGSA